MIGYIIIGIVSFYVFWYLMIYRPRRIKRMERIQKLSDQLIEEYKKGLEKYSEINEKIKKGVIPTDEEIDLHYKMYLKKFEMDKDENQWDVTEPMDFVSFEEEAKRPTEKVDIDAEKGLYFNKFGGWEFLIQMTSDMCVDGNQFVRFHDYEGMVRREENNEAV